MIDLNRFHDTNVAKGNDSDLIDPDIVAKQRRQKLAKIRTEIRERNLSDINRILKNN